MAESLTLELRLTSDGSQVVGEVRGATEALKRLAGGEREATRDAQKLAQESSSLGRRLSSLNRNVIGLQGAVRGLALGALIRDVTRTTLAWETHERTLKAVTGSQRAADMELEFARGLAERLGLQVQSLTGDYARFIAAARGTRLEGELSRDVFAAVAESARVLGLSADDTTGVLRALQQMISKGTVQAEELRGQLGERLPGAFQIAARAMGVSTSKLGEMLEQGEVLADDLLPRLAVQLREEFGGAVEEASNSAAANFARLDTAVDELKRSIGRELVPALATFTTYLSNEVVPTTRYWLEELGLVERKLASLSLGELQLELQDMRAELAGLNKDLSLDPSKAGGVLFGGDDDTPGARRRRDALAARVAEAERREAELLARVNAKLPQRDRALLGFIGGDDGFDDMGIYTPPSKPGGTSTKPKKVPLTQTQQLAIDLNKRAAENIEKAAKAREELAESTRNLQDRLDPLVGLTRQFVTETAMLERAEREGILTSEQRAATMKSLKQEYIDAGKALRTDYNEALKETDELAFDVEGTVRDLGFTFSSAFEDALVKGKSMREVLQGISEDIARIVTRKAITEPLSNAVGGFAEGLIEQFFGDGFSLSQAPSGPPAGFGHSQAATQLHSGGLVGRDGTLRLVSPDVFRNAPRMHRGGLAGDEVPAILQRGERVLPRGSDGGGVTVHYAPVIQAVDTRSGAEFLVAQRGVIVGLINEAFNRRGVRGPVR